MGSGSVRRAAWSGRTGREIRDPDEIFRDVRWNLAGSKLDRRVYGFSA